MAIIVGARGFDETGMPHRHAAAIQEVADNTDHVIIFRAVGKQATRLLHEGYAAKGFRIDTKSCDWGPMSGFVCVDPRLSKGGGDADKVKANRDRTAEALEGAVRQDALGGMPERGDAGWRAGCKPIVISAARLEELQGKGLGGETKPNGIIHGRSTHTGSGLTMPWALIPSPFKVTFCVIPLSVALWTRASCRGTGSAWGPASWDREGVS